MEASADCCSVWWCVWRWMLQEPGSASLLSPVVLHSSSFLPGGHLVPPSDPCAVDSLDFLAHQAEEDRTNLTSNNEIESEDLLQLQEWSLDLFIYFYHHKSLLWWDILSKGNFFFIGGVIDFAFVKPYEYLHAPALVHFLTMLVIFAFSFTF